LVGGGIGRGDAFFLSILLTIFSILAVISSIIIPIRPRISGWLILISGIGIVILTMFGGFSLWKLMQNGVGVAMLLLLIPLAPAVPLIVAGKRTLMKSRPASDYIHPVR
jgi:hypothetical protein